jgi:hypothetical protein
MYDHVRPLLGTALKNALFFQPQFAHHRSPPPPPLNSIAGILSSVLAFMLFAVVVCKSSAQLI